LHHILKEIRRFDISFNSKTPMDAQQTQPSNNAGDSDSVNKELNHDNMLATFIIGLIFHNGVQYTIKKLND
jgi:hemin uptake protein HemP